VALVGVMLPDSPVRILARSHHVGYVSGIYFGTSDPGDDPVAIGLRDGLKEFGWTAGENLTIDYRYFADNAVVPALIHELVEPSVDLLIAVGTPAARAAHDATDRVPVVFIGVTDPVAAGVAESLSRPGGNATGLSFAGQVSTNAKRLQLFKELVPSMSRVVDLVNPANQSTQVGLPEMRSAATSLHMDLVEVSVEGEDDLPEALDKIATSNADGLLLQTDPVISTHLADILAFAQAHHLATNEGLIEHVNSGVLMGYGPNISKQSRRAGYYVDRIFRGDAPGGLPVEQPTTLEFAVNRSTADALGLTIAPEVADEVTEWFP